MLCARTDAPTRSQRWSVSAGLKLPLFFPLFPLLFPLFNPGSFRHPMLARRQIVQPSKGLDDSLP